MIFPCVSYVEVFDAIKRLTLNINLTTCHFKRLYVNNTLSQKSEKMNWFQITVPTAKKAAV